MFAVRLSPGAAAPGVGLAFTDRHGGFSRGAWESLNLGRVGTDPDAPRNLELLRAELGLRTLVRIDQTHTATVRHITAAPRGQYRPELEGDALVTTLPGVGLLTRAADCVPVLFASADGAVVAAAHAGRVGLLAGILPATVAAMTELTDAPIRAWVGPHICGACYEVPEEMRAAGARILSDTWATTSWGTPSLDLGAGVAQQLADAGVEVARHDPCTRTDERFFSHRRDPRAGRQAGVVFRAGRVAESGVRGVG